MNSSVLTMSNSGGYVLVAAAVGLQGADMVELRHDHGARADAVNWTRVVCVADAVDASDVRAVLEQRRRTAASISCEAVSTRW